MGFFIFITSTFYFLLFSKSINFHQIFLIQLSVFFLRLDSWSHKIPYNEHASKLIRLGSIFNVRILHFLVHYRFPIFIPVGRLFLFFFLFNYTTSLPQYRWFYTFLVYLVNPLLDLSNALVKRTFLQILQVLNFSISSMLLRWKKMRC